LSVSVSMMVGWGGSAPIIVNRCTNAAARAPLPALWVGAAGACDGAADGVSPLGADSAGALDWVSAGASAGASIGAVGGGGGGGATGAGATGLTGDSGLVGLVTDLVHESLVRFHWPQMGEPYGSGQTLCRMKSFWPTNPAWQASTLASVLVWQVGGFGVQSI